MRCYLCSVEVSETSRFCPQCGAAVGADAALSFERTFTIPSSGSAAVAAARKPSAPPFATLVDEGRFLPGTILNGRYRIVSRIGRGGMGEVYRATDLQLGQTVALKFLPSTAVIGEDALKRFRNEARTARSVTHPNVCRVHDIGEAEGQHYLSMEYVEGEDLASLLRRIGHLPSCKAVDVGQQICSALAAAHKRGVLHRDLKPANIMIDDRGQVRIMDFGLAAAAGYLQGTESRNGTPAYMAPEQLAGESVTAQSDLYALGLVLYEIFTGKRALMADSPAEMLRLRREGAPVPPSAVATNIDPSVSRVILSCLQADPQRRPVSAEAIAAALPGGDPLAAALAKGETPSPGMVAAAGQTEAVSRGFAFLCLGVVLAGLAAIAIVGPKVHYLSRVPLDNPPEVLARKAREIASQLGYTEKPVDTAHGFRRAAQFISYVATRGQPVDWTRISAGSKTPVYFWYRESPRRLWAMDVLNAGMVTPTDPPTGLRKMIHIQMDGLGRLQRFEANPGESDAAREGNVTPQWERLFTAAGLDPGRFIAAVPEASPQVSFDVRAAWNGTYLDMPETPVRIETAAWRGRPVYFEINGPWLSQATNPGRMLGADVVLYACLGATILLWACVATRRNLRAQRGDRTGATRLAMVVLCAQLLSWLITAHHGIAPEEVYLVGDACGWALFSSAAVWILYLALEPYVRRRWPRSIITWTRLLAGNIRDALVARDLLLGVATGTLGTLFYLARDYSFMRFGASPAQWRIDELLGANRVLSDILRVTVSAGVVSLGVFFSLYLLRGLFRRQVLASVAVAALISALLILGSAGPVRIALPFAVIGGAMAVMFLFRYGLLALIVLMIVSELLLLLPLPADLSSWYAGNALIAPALILTLSLYAFYRSLGREPLFKSDPLAD